MIILENYYIIKHTKSRRVITLFSFLLSKNSKNDKRKKRNEKREKRIIIRGGKIDKKERKIREKT